MTKLYSSIFRISVLEPKGFKRVHLQPGETKKGDVPLSANIAFYDKNMNLIVEPGEFQVQVGSSSQDIRLTGQFEVKGNVKVIPHARTYFASCKLV